MFHSKKAQVDFKRVTQKFLDAKRESKQRANALRTLLGEIFYASLNWNPGHFGNTENKIDR